MLKLVRLALARPYTFIVLALLILIAGPLAALRTPTDIFPDIRIPVISVVWNYAGLQPADMAGRIVTYYERTLGTTVNDVAHIESQSFRSFGIVKIFFQPSVDIRTATAQVTSISQTVLKQMPPGTTPPQILNYNASTVPVLQLALTSDTLNEQQLGDYATNVIRPQLLSVAGSRFRRHTAARCARCRSISIRRRCRPRGCPRRMSRPRWRSRTRSSRPARRRSAASSTTSGSTTAR